LYPVHDDPLFLAIVSTFKSKYKPKIKSTRSRVKTF
jgi:hypothetical protein